MTTVPQRSNPALPLLGADLEQAISYARAEKASATRRAYQSGFGLFETWCNNKGVTALPAEPETVAAFLAFLKGLRDRALLLLGFAGAFRRSELVALDVADLEETEEGMRVAIRRSKTDQEGKGEIIAIVRSSVNCPVKAVKNWLQATSITEGSLFRSVTKGGQGWELAAD